MIWLLVLVAIAIPALTAQTASGRWMGTVDAFGSPLKIYLSLQQQSIDLTGTVMYGGAILPIEHAFVNGNEAAFETRDRSGHRIRFRLAILTGHLQGEANFGAQTAYVDVTPLPPDEPAVILSIKTDAKGRIAEIHVAHTLGPRADAQAIQAARKMTFFALPNSSFEAILPEGAVAGR